MALSLMGRKRGMTQLFDAKGNVIVVTVIEAQPNVVTQIKTRDKDGYEAVQLGFELVKAKDPRRQELRTKKPQRGFFAKNGIAARKALRESCVSNIEAFSLGQEVSVDIFAEGIFVDVTAISKGKGFQGVMKRHNFAGGPASHGASRCHRLAGSTGMRSTPGRNLPNGKKAGHMGAERVTVQNLEIVKVVPESNLLVVKGAIPGARNGLVHVTAARKKNVASKQTSKSGG